MTLEAAVLQLLKETEPRHEADAAVQASMATLLASVQRVSERLERLAPVEPFLAKLEAFFGPMLAGKQPPLDGDEIATKGYVDAAITRLSSALSAKIRQAQVTLRDASLAEGVDRVEVPDFGWAIRQIRTGAKVQRAGWNGKGMWIAMEVPDAQGSKRRRSYIYMSEANGMIVPWAASQTDVLATDWRIYRPEYVEQARGRT
jgi:hypothetical protein